MTSPLRHRIVPLNWIQWLTLLLAAATAVGFAYSFGRINDVQHHQNDALRSIICRAERVVARPQPDVTTPERRRAHRFYVNALADAHLAPCDDH